MTKSYCSDAVCSLARAPSIGIGGFSSEPEYEPDIADVRSGLGDPVVVRSRRCGSGGGLPAGGALAAGAEIGTTSRYKRESPLQASPLRLTRHRLQPPLQRRLPRRQLLPRRGCTFRRAAGGPTSPGRVYRCQRSSPAVHRATAFHPSTSQSS
jgi:hypothetical protein